ncbi:MAG: FAD-dependent oxidoreductase, partial [Planctomycetaceae bacterium]|nr:FAD-dependent oxidoreductase [Planctomycetaceae bacterium]
WLTDPLALGSYACYKTGQWTTIAGTEAAPVGNLYFAGEHCHTFETGYMNSGVASGRATARALLVRLDGH